jgi:hypothetical protein
LKNYEKPNEDKLQACLEFFISRHVLKLHFKVQSRQLGPLENDKESFHQERLYAHEVELDQLNFYLSINLLNPA